MQVFGEFYYDDGTVYLAMKNIAALGPPAILCLHCENWEIGRVLKEELKAQGRTDPAAWDDKSPAFCEAGHVRDYSYYAKVTGCPLYNIHTTNRETIDEIVKARADGVRVWAQCAPHYLSLTRDKWRINPPLRSRENVDACWEAIKTGIIDCIGSDHVGDPKVPEKVMAEINHQILTVLVKSGQEEVGQAATTTDEEILIFLEEESLTNETSTEIISE